ncbi:MAG: hypothetical protein IPP73_18180 [Chitinophagaceae bacterium]|nr:hypothetical protein [Chitinophagaceae bacterium]
MSLFFYILSLAGLFILFIVIRALLLLRKDVPANLFAEALKNENSGNLESAVTIYKEALQEASKSRSQHDLREKIVEKLKVLNTVLAYNRNFQAGR